MWLLVLITEIRNVPRLVFEITLIACVIPAFSVLVRIPPSGREPLGHWTLEPGQ